MTDWATIRGLEPLWARSTMRAPPAPLTHADRMLLALLRLGLGQVLEKLHHDRPEWPDFTAWIAAMAGQPDPVEVARYHAALDGLPPPSDVQARIAAIEAAEPALSPAELEQWQRDGYVVLRGALSRAEADAAAAVLWQHIAARPEDPASWYAEPARGLWFGLWQHPALDVARQSPRVHKAFAQIWGTADLWIQHDRMSFNQPVRDDCPFLGSPLHVDTSLAAPMPLGTQAIVYLTDTPAVRGALQVVPGFHRRCDAWLQGLGHADPRQVNVSAGATPVPGAAGDMVIWHHALPHGATPNRGDFPRIVQYLNLFPAFAEDDRPWI